MELHEDLVRQTPGDVSPQFTLSTIEQSQASYRGICRHPGLPAVLCALSVDPSLYHPTQASLTPAAPDSSSQPQPASAMSGQLQSGPAIFSQVTTDSPGPVARPSRALASPSARPSGRASWAYWMSLFDELPDYEVHEKNGKGLSVLKHHNRGRLVPLGGLPGADRAPGVHGPRVAEPRYRKSLRQCRRECNQKTATHLSI